jgi:hypothetical protein
MQGAGADALAPSRFSQSRRWQIGSAAVHNGQHIARFTILLVRTNVNLP